MHTMDLICFLKKEKKRVWAWQIFEEEVEGRRRKRRELRKKKV